MMTVSLILENNKIDSSILLSLILNTEDDQVSRTMIYKTATITDLKPYFNHSVDNVNSNTPKVNLYS